jgi:hypothetical protein
VLTHEAILAYRAERERIWDREREAWTLLNRARADEYILCQEFRRKHGLSDEIVLEQQMCDWLRDNS